MNEEIVNEDGFDKKIYHVMVENGSISGREICLLLYDQKYFKMNQTTYARLRTGMLSPFNFIKLKIRSLDIPPGRFGAHPLCLFCCGYLGEYRQSLIHGILSKL